MKYHPLGKKKTKNTPVPKVKKKKKFVPEVNICIILVILLCLVDTSSEPNMILAEIFSYLKFTSCTSKSPL